VDQTERSSIDPRGNVRDGGLPSVWPPPFGNISGVGDNGETDCDAPPDRPVDVAWNGATARTGRTHSGVTDKLASEVGDNMMTTMPLNR
jgi:hypothetical protein